MLVSPMLLLKCAYLGLRYYGFQKQQKLPTIQLFLQKAFELHELPRNFKYLSRTDKKVSALEQLLLMRLDNEIDINSINSTLPPDIKVYAQSLVDQFSYSKFIGGKEYLYIAPIFDDIDEDLLEKIIYYINNRTHNYYHFVKRPSITIRSHSLWMRLEIEYKFFNSTIKFFVKGHKFYWEQVRRLITFIMATARKIISLSAARKILNGYPPKGGIPPAPPEGLILWRILWKKPVKFRYQIDLSAMKTWLEKKIIEYLSSMDIKWTFPPEQ